MYSLNSFYKTMKIDLAESPYMVDPSLRCGQISEGHHHTLHLRWQIMPNKSDAVMERAAIETFFLHYNVPGLELESTP